MHIHLSDCSLSPLLLQLRTTKPKPWGSPHQLTRSRQSITDKYKAFHCSEYQCWQCAESTNLSNDCSLRLLPSRDLLPPRLASPPCPSGVYEKHTKFLGCCVSIRAYSQPHVSFSVSACCFFIPDCPSQVRLQHRRVVYNNKVTRDWSPAQQVFLEHPSHAQYFGRSWGVHVLAKESVWWKSTQQVRL